MVSEQNAPMSTMTTLFLCGIAALASEIFASKTNFHNTLVVDVAKKEALVQSRKFPVMPWNETDVTTGSLLTQGQFPYSCVQALFPHGRESAYWQEEQLAERLEKKLRTAGEQLPVANPTF